jgi:hypothetical protein
LSDTEQITKRRSGAAVKATGPGARRGKRTLMAASATVTDAKLKRLVRMAIAVLERRLDANLDALEREGRP